MYGEMLPRQPLRFLLADDPGAGKTIMAGLLIKELMLRGDLQRCLVVSPRAPVEQWQDELGETFGIDFDILTRDKIEASRVGNPFAEDVRACGSAGSSPLAQPTARRPRRAGGLGPGDRRRGAQDERFGVVRGGHRDQALPARQEAP